MMLFVFSTIVSPIGSLSWSALSLSTLPLALLAFLSCTTLAFYGVAWFFTRRFFAQPLPPVAATQPRVSILIPVRGLDEGAKENWRSFCQQDYPTYDVLFGVMDPDDPAVPILQEVVAEFPHHSRLYTDLPPRGINHKISNLSYLTDASHSETVVLADSDIRVTPDYLEQVTRPLADPQVGMVTCGYFDQHPRQLGAALAALGRSVDFIPSLLIAQALDGELKFALGPTIVLKRSILDNFGGLSRVMNYIGIDFHLGRLTVESGYRVELSQYLLQNDCGQETPSQVFQRELRWCRTIRWTRGPDYYGLIFTHGIVYSLLLMVISGFQPWAVGLWAIVLGVRLAQGWVILSTLNASDLRSWLWLLPLRDLMTFVVWVAGSYGRQIFWRGRWLQVSGQGQLNELGQ